MTPVGIPPGLDHEVRRIVREELDADERFTVAKLGTVEPRTTEQLGIRASEDFPDTSVVHWDARGGDLACGAPRGHSSATNGPSLISCVPCSRIHDVTVERDDARGELLRIRARVRQAVDDAGSTFHDAITAALS